MTWAGSEREGAAAMFTGLIEEIGRVTRVERTGRAMLLRIAAAKVLEDTVIGDSIAVNGVCLTVVQLKDGQMTVDAVPETVRRTTLRVAAAGDQVNLERALLSSSRLGGHLVAGHVDGVGTVTDVVRDETARLLTVAAEPEIMRYIAEKGSVAIDGVSLTVMTVTEQSFQVSLIPHSAAMTTLLHTRSGSRVNLEVDMIARYVERLLSRELPAGDCGGSTGLTVERLRSWGY